MTDAHGFLLKTLVWATMLAGWNLPLVAQTAAPDPAPIEMPGKRRTASTRVRVQPS